LARPTKSKTTRKSSTAVSAEKLGVLRGISTELVDTEAADATAILAFLQFYHSADLIVKAVERDLATHNLSVARYAILRLLSGREPMTLGWVAEKHFSRLSNITAMIDRLVRDKLVDRFADDKDRRVVRVRVTRLGEQVLDTTRQPHRQFIARTMAGLSEDELRRLIALSGKLSAPLEGVQ
jgi:DNA-binding MarR family transcriptional regulator